MQRIEGVETVFGECVFDVSACAVIEEDDGRGEDCTDDSIVHHNWEGEEYLHYCL